MKNRLPIYIEDNKMPLKYEKRDNNNYGYISILYLLSILITIFSIIITIISII